MPTPYSVLPPLVQHLRKQEQPQPEQQFTLRQIPGVPYRAEPVPFVTADRLTFPGVQATPAFQDTIMQIANVDDEKIPMGDKAGLIQLYLEGAGATSASQYFNRPFADVESQWKAIRARTNPQEYDDEFLTPLEKFENNKSEEEQLKEATDWYLGLPATRAKRSKEFVDAQAYDPFDPKGEKFPPIEVPEDVIDQYKGNVLVPKDKLFMMDYYKSLMSPRMELAAQAYLQNGKIPSIGLAEKLTLKEQQILEGYFNLVKEEQSASLLWRYNHAIFSMGRSMTERLFEFPHRNFQDLLVELEYGGKIGDKEFGNPEIARRTADQLAQSRAADVMIERLKAPKWADPYEGREGLLAFAQEQTDKTIMGVAQSIPYTGGMIAGGLLGGPKGAFIGMTLVGLSHAESVSQTLEFDYGVNRQDAQLQGVAVAGVMVFTERLQIMKSIDAGKFAALAVKNKSFGRAVLGFTNAAGRGYSYNLAQEFLTEGTEIFAYAYADDPDASVEATIDGIKEAAPDIFRITAGMGLLIGGPSFANTYLQKSKQLDTLDKIDNMADLQKADQAVKRRQEADTQAVRDLVEAEGFSDITLSRLAEEYNRRKDYDFEGMVRQYGIDNPTLFRKAMEDYTQTESFAAGIADDLLQDELAENARATDPIQDPEETGAAAQQEDFFQPVIDKFAAVFPKGLPIKMYETQQEFEQATGRKVPQGQRAEGFKSKDEIAIVRENIPSQKRLVEVLAHEQLGHYGLDIKDPGQQRMILDGLRQSIESAGLTIDFIRDRVASQYQGIEADMRQRLAAEGVGEIEVQRQVDDLYMKEFIAQTAEKVINGETLTIEERTAWQRVLQWLRQKLGMADSQALADVSEDAAQIVKQLAEGLMTPVEAELTGRELQSGIGRGLREDMDDVNAMFTEATDLEMLEYVSEFEGPDQLPAVGEVPDVTPEQPEQPVRELGDDSMQRFPVLRILVDLIKADPRRFQYKRGVNEEGEQKALEGEWNETAAGIFLLWESANGELFVANGHHRLAHAKRLGVEEVNAQVLREVDGWSAQDAFAKAAEDNILDGKGTIYDHADYFRNAEGVTEELAASRGLRGSGFLIGTIASDNTYSTFLSQNDGQGNVVTSERILSIIKGAGNNRVAQDVALTRVGERNLSNVELQQYARIVASQIESGKAPTSQSDTGEEMLDLFGSADDAEVKAWEEEQRGIAREQARMLREVREEIRAIEGTVKNDGRVQRAAKAGVRVKDAKKTRAEVERLKAREEAILRNDAAVESEARQRFQSGGEAASLNDQAMDEDGDWFSLAEPVETSGKLVALHNLSEGNILFSDRLGGIPVPSIAVTKEGFDLEGFGEVTLIGRKGLVDPAKDPLFDADAYTNRFPKIEYKKPSKKQRDLFDKEMDSLQKQMVEDGFPEKGRSSDLYDLEKNVIENPDFKKALSRPDRNIFLAYKYLKETGGDTTPVMKKYSTQAPFLGMFPEIDLYVQNMGNPPSYAEEESRVEWERKHQAGLATVIGEALRKDMDSDSPILVEDQKDLEYFESQWLNSEGAVQLGLFDRALADSKKMGSEVFDPYKTKDKFQAQVLNSEQQFRTFAEDFLSQFFSEPFVRKGRKLVPANLENIVSVMLSRKVKGDEGTMTMSEGKIRAMMASRFPDLESAREAAKDQIQDSDTVEKKREEAKQVLSDYRDLAAKYYRWEDTWNAFDDAMKALVDSLSGKGIKRALADNDFKGVDDQLIRKAEEARAALLSVPVSYFEAKPQRAVPLSDFAGAAIPSSLSAEARAILEKSGVEVEEYQKEQDRKEAVISLQKRLSEEVMFSLQSRENAPADFPDSLESVISSTNLATLKGKTPEQKEQYRRAKKEGDAIAAAEVVGRVLKQSTVDQLKAILGDREGIIVPVIQPEGTPNANMIPISLAEDLESVLPARFVKSIARMSGRPNTGATGAQRSQNVIQFKGEIEPGKPVILVDDTFTSGQTLLALYDHLARQGHEVIAIVTLASSRWGKGLRPSLEKQQALLDKSGLTSEELENEVGKNEKFFTTAEINSYLFSGAAGREGIRERFGSANAGRPDGASGSGFSTDKRIPEDPSADSEEVEYSLAQNSNPKRNAALVLSSRIVKGREVDVADVVKLVPDIPQNQAKEIVAFAYGIASSVEVDRLTRAEDPRMMRALRNAESKQHYRNILAGAEYAAEERGKIVEQARQRLNEERKQNRKALYRQVDGLTVEELEEGGKDSLLKQLDEALVPDLIEAKTEVEKWEPKENLEEDGPPEEGEEEGYAEANTKEPKEKVVPRPDSRNPEEGFFARDWVDTVKVAVEDKLVRQGVLKANAKNNQSTAEFREAFKKTAITALWKKTKELTYGYERERLITRLNRMNNRVQLPALEADIIRTIDSINLNAVRENRADIVKEIMGLLAAAPIDAFSVSTRQELKKSYGRFEPLTEKEKRVIEPALHQFIQAARKAIEMNELAVIARMREIEKQLAQNDVPEGKDSDAWRAELEREFHALHLLGGLNGDGKTVGEVAAARDELEKMVRGSFAKLERARIDRQQRLDKKRQIWIKAQDALVKKQGPGKDGKIRDFFTIDNMMLLHFLEDAVAAGDAESKAMAREIYDEIHEADWKERVLSNRSSKRFLEGVQEITGVKGEKWLKEFVKPRKEMAEFSKYGKEMSRDQVMQIYAGIEQADYRDYEDNTLVQARVEMKARIEEVMSEQDFEVLDLLRSIYDSERQQLSDITEEITGMRITTPDVKYMPVKMEVYQGGLSGSHMEINYVPKALTPRVKSRYDFDESVGMTDLFFQRVKDNAHFQAFGKLNIELRGIFQHQIVETATAVAQGESYQKKLYMHLQDVMAGKVLADKESTSFLDKLGAFYQLKSLSMNVEVMLKQVTSIPNFLGYVATGDFMRHMGSWATAEGYEAMREIWNSPQRRERFSGEFQELMDVAFSRDTTLPKGLSHIRDFFRAGMVTNNLGDVVPTLLIGQGIYRSLLKTADYQAMKPEEAKEKALTHLFKLVELSQQSTRLKDMGYSRRRRMRILAMFQSTTSQFFSEYVSAFRAWRRASEEGKPEARKKLNLILLKHHLLLPGAFQIASILIRAAKGDEPDEDDLKILIGSLLAGPFGGLYAMGSFVTSIANVLTDRTNYLGQQMIPVGGLNQDIQTAGDLAKAIGTLDWEAMLDEADALGRSMFSPYRTISGAVQNYSEDD